MPRRAVESRWLPPSNLVLCHQCDRHIAACALTSALIILLHSLQVVPPPSPMLAGNGWFYAISQRAVAQGAPDPMPLHTAGLKALNVI